MYLLYITEGCHLCDLALAEIAQCPVLSNLTVQCVEIGDDDDLIARYGIRIPVLRHPKGHELNWPFNVQDITAFVSD